MSYNTTKKIKHAKWHISHSHADLAVMLLTVASLHSQSVVLCETTIATSHSATGGTVKKFHYGKTMYPGLLLGLLPSFFAAASHVSNNLGRQNMFLL